MGKETFITRVGCMDGRSVHAVTKWGKEKFGVDYVDDITEPGMAGKLANDPDQSFLESIRKKILISVEKHGSETVIVSGHEECAGNPVENDKHINDVLKSARTVRSLVDNVNIIPVFVRRGEPHWVVEEL